MQPVCKHRTCMCKPNREVLFHQAIVNTFHLHTHTPYTHTHLVALCVYFDSVTLQTAICEVDIRQRTCTSPGTGHTAGDTLLGHIIEPCPKRTLFNTQTPRGCQEEVVSTSNTVLWTLYKVVIVYTLW